MSAYLFQIQSTIIVALMLYGVSQRKNTYKHVKVMKLCIIWDLLLIAQIELTRGAIVKASKVMSNALILNIHVSIAVATVLLYFVMLYTGKKLLKGNKKIKPFHRLFGITTLTLRVAAFITSFLIL